MAIKDQTNLIRDLLDPDLDTAEVARRHNADPTDLRAAVRSEAFQTAAAAMREVDEARTAALIPVHNARAIQRLARIAAQPAETTAQTESARRAATALIRAGRPSRPADTPGRSALRADSSSDPALHPDTKNRRADDNAHAQRSPGVNGPGIHPAAVANATSTHLPGPHATLGDLLAALAGIGAPAQPVLERQPARGRTAASRVAAAAGAAPSG